VRYESDGAKMSESKTTADPNDDATDYAHERPADPHLGCHERKRFGIATGEKNGVAIDFLQDDPDGFRTYRRSFLFTTHRQFQIEGNQVTQRVTIRQAEQIALFLLRQSVSARYYLTVRSIRQALGMRTTPREP
jgi:hypothetical protein